jgi:hypothetical protein
VPARAQQLTYTTHVEFRKVDAPQPSNPALIPVYANLASGLSRTAGRDIPGGTVDFDVALNSKELRVQASRPTGELSDGTMQVVHSNASAVFANAASRSFWRFAEPPAVVLAAQEDRMANLNPSASIKRLGDFATIAGIKAEHVTCKSRVRRGWRRSTAPTPPSSREPIRRRRPVRDCYSRWTTSDFPCA